MSGIECFYSVNKMLLNMAGNTNRKWNALGCTILSFLLQELCHCWCLVTLSWRWREVIHGECVSWAP